MYQLKHNNEVIAEFDTYKDALTTGYLLYGLDEFTVENPDAAPVLITRLLSRETL